MLGLQVMVHSLEAHTRICCQMEAMAGSMEATLDARLTRLAAFMERHLLTYRPRVRRKGVARSRSSESSSQPGHRAKESAKRNGRNSFDIRSLSTRQGEQDDSPVGAPAHEWQLHASVQDCCAVAPRAQDTPAND